MLTEILVPIAFFAVVFGIVYVVTTARNKERMALIENGADPKLFRPDPRFRMFTTLTVALFFIGVGLGLVFGNLIAHYTHLDEESGYFAMICLFGGMGLFASFIFRKKVLNEGNKKEEDE